MASPNPAENPFTNNEMDTPLQPEPLPEQPVAAQETVDLFKDMRVGDLTLDLVREGLEMIHQPGDPEVDEDMVATVHSMAVAALRDKPEATAEEIADAFLEAATKRYAYELTDDAPSVTDRYATVDEQGNVLAVEDTPEDSAKEARQMRGIDG